MFLTFCLSVFPYQPGVAYESVAYKKKRVIFKYTEHFIHFVLSEIGTFEDLY